MQKSLEEIRNNCVAQIIEGEVSLFKTLYLQKEVSNNNYVYLFLGLCISLRTMGSMGTCPD